MDYFQGVVTEYLRADRAVFVNTECCIQLNEAPNPDASGPHWYCDAVAVNLRAKTVDLCEVSYSSTLYSLLGRLSAWSAHWPGLKAALKRDCSIPDGFRIAPHVFIPTHLRNVLERKLVMLSVNEVDPMPAPLVTDLEEVLPWRYRSWNRMDEVVVTESRTPAESEKR